jgi:hypothetical protein
MYKFRLLTLNPARQVVRCLHNAQANVLQTSIDKNSSEYQVKIEIFLKFFSMTSIIFFHDRKILNLYRQWSTIYK